MAEAFKRLVKLVARAFYDDCVVKGDNQRRAGRSGNRGLGVVVLDALTSRQWAREEDLARSLKVNSKQLRRILRFFEEEKFVNRCYRKETVKSAKISGDSPEVVKEGDGKTRIHTHSYCCLDYAQIYDVVRYRLHRMKKKLKDELEDKNTIQAYVCPNCSRRYSAFDALQLVSPDDDYFHCERCSSILIAESDRIVAEDIGGRDDISRERRREKLRDMLWKMEEQLKPLTMQLARMKDLSVPEFGSLQSWEARFNAAHRAAAGDVSTANFSKSVQVLGYGGPPTSCIGETKIEVRISSSGTKEEISAAETSAAAKIIPPWMTKQGTSLSREQASASSAVLEGKQEEMKESTKSLQEEYVTAYYEAYARMQMDMLEASRKKEEELESSEVNAGIADRQVGEKSKREEFEWEEASPIGVVLGELQRADAFEEEGENLEWEEG